MRSGRWAPILPGWIEGVFVGGYVWDLNAEWVKPLADSVVALLQLKEWVGDDADGLDSRAPAGGVSCAYPRR